MSGEPDDPDGEGAEGAAEEDSPPDGKPPIDPDDRVDVDVSDLSDEIEAEAGASGGPESGGDDGADDPDEEPPERSPEGAPEGGPEGTSWGDIYVDGLAVVLVAVVEEVEEAPTDLTTEEVYELACSPPVNLAEQADRVAEQMGGASQLPPEQALVVSTLLLVGAVLVTKTDLANEAVSSALDGMEAV